MLIDVLNDPKFSTFDLSRLGTIIIGGSPIPLELLRGTNRVLPNTNMVVRILERDAVATLKHLPRYVTECSGDNCSGGKS